MKIFLIVVISLAGLFALLVVAGGLYIFVTTIQRQGASRKRLRGEQQGKPPSPFRSHLAVEGVWWATVSTVRTTLTAADGVKLTAYALFAKQKTNKTALVMHGHDSTPATIAFITKMFYEHGYNVLVPAMRGNEESGGLFFSFGIRESDDALLWLDRAAELFGEDAEIVAYGNSLGGATACFLSEKGAERQLRCLIADCPLSSLMGVIKHNMPMVPSFLMVPAGAFCDLLCRAFHGFSFIKNTPIKAVKNARLPIMFVHGKQDPTTAWEMSEQMHAVCPTEKELLLLEDCPHGVAYFADTPLYEKTVFGFIERFM